MPRVDFFIAMGFPPLSSKFEISRFLRSVSLSLSLGTYAVIGGEETDNRGVKSFDLI